MSDGAIFVDVVRDLIRGMVGEAAATTVESHFCDASEPVSSKFGARPWVDFGLSWFCKSGEQAFVIVLVVGGMTQGVTHGTKIAFTIPVITNTMPKRAAALAGIILWGIGIARASSQRIFYPQEAAVSIKRAGPAEAGWIDNCDELMPIVVLERGDSTRWRGRDAGRPAHRICQEVAAPLGLMRRTIRPCSSKTVTC